MLLADKSSSDDEEKDLGEIKSNFEIRTAKLKKEIKKMEEQAIMPKKPWQMIGEVNSIERPENSLLQEHLDYDNVAKQAPIVTEEVSRRLEDINMQRIKDKAWDDVERKIKPIENPYEYKKKLILDQVIDQLYLLISLYLWIIVFILNYILKSSQFELHFDSLVFIYSKEKLRKGYFQLLHMVRLKE